MKQPQLVYEHQQQVWHPDITNTDWLLLPQYLSLKVLASFFHTYLLLI